MVRASASPSVDLGFIPLVESLQKTLKIIFTASLLDARHLGEVVENKRLLVVPLDKAINGTPSPLCARHVAQFSFPREGWWQEGHPIVKQMRCYENEDYLLWQPFGKHPVVASSTANYQKTIATNIVFIELSMEGK